MKPNIIRTRICTTVTTAAAVTLSGLVPVTALAAPASPEMASKLAGKTVFLDPGHQGPNHTENLSRQVDDGRGGTKDCQTTGMTTVNGIPEHTINWNVAQLVKSSLESLGARVELSRRDDSGWGGCVDDRARAASRSGAEVAVSIHADSAPAQSHGFHLIVPQLPIPDARVDQIQSGAGLAASKAVRDAYLQAGFSSADYAGVRNGLQTRADIAGPALTAVPIVFVEMGNGANAQDAALLEGQEGQLEHAIAITTGLVGFLLGAPPAGKAGSAVDRPAAAFDQSAPAVDPAQNVPQAVPGSNGAQAVPGSNGAQAVPGSNGAQAVPGSNGAQAVPGSNGAQAVPGSNGAQAVPGSNGAQAVPGSNGAQAVPGSNGAQAVPGSNGAQAVPGANGAQAVPGSNGAQAVPGSNGAQAVPGSNGAQAVPGSNGAQAVPGSNGAQAVPGSNGAQAVPGSNGAQQVPGATAPKSVPGSNGTQPQILSVPGLSANTLVDIIMPQLLPLASSLGVDSSVLVNLAYTLASTLVGPTS